MLWIASYTAQNHHVRLTPLRRVDGTDSEAGMGEIALGFGSFLDPRADKAQFFAQEHEEMILFAVESHEHYCFAF